MKVKRWSQKSARVKTTCTWKTQQKMCAVFIQGIQHWHTCARKKNHCKVIFQKWKFHKKKKQNESSMIQARLYHKPPVKVYCSNPGYYLMPVAKGTFRSKETTQQQLEIPGEIPNVLPHAHGVAVGIPRLLVFPLHCNLVGYAPPSPFRIGSLAACGREGDGAKSALQSHPIARLQLY